MLALTRGPRQRVIITASNGEVISVEINKVLGNQVNLGFEAPRDVKILREELQSKEDAA